MKEHTPLVLREHILYIKVSFRLGFLIRNDVQEYGEVVCVMGSSANFSNIEVFLQANASMAIEPRYPQLCQSVPVSLPPKVGPSPVATSQLLNSVASSLSFKAS